MVGSLMTGHGKRETGGDRPGILPLLEDGDVYVLVSFYVTTGGFTVTHRASLAVTVVPQAVPLAFRGYV